MRPSDELRAGIHNAAVAAQEAVDRERQALAAIPKREIDKRRVQALKVQAAAAELDRCLAALFSTEPTNSKGRL